MWPLKLLSSPLFVTTWLLNFLLSPLFLTIWLLQLFLSPICLTEYPQNFFYCFFPLNMCTVLCGTPHLPSFSHSVHISVTAWLPKPPETHLSFHIDLLYFPLCCVVILLCIVVLFVSHASLLLSL